MQSQSSKKNQVQVELDNEGCPLMSFQTTKYYCLADGLPENPELNQKLYLYQKGFKKILSLSLYNNLRSLWLNSNKIAKIQNLQGLSKLVCLYLNDNAIQKIEGVQNLKDLQILNLQKNKISKVQNLLSNYKLNNLNLGSNLLSDRSSIEQLQKMPNIRTLDISKNEIENSKQTYEIIQALKSLTNLNLKSTPFARGLINYRKNMIAILSNLKFFDDRPVLQTQHRICEAWLNGGQESEKKQRERIMKQQQLQRKQQRNKQLFSETESSFQKDVSNQVFKAPSFENRKQTAINQVQPKFNQVGSQKQEKGQKMQKIDEVKEDQRPGLNIEEPKNQKIPKWKKQYELLLQALLEKHQFDFSEVQPRFNMIINGISKKLSRQINRYEVSELEKIWTQIQIKRRVHCNM